jgi:tetratricopeptide (TPR) repeat protein
MSHDTSVQPQLADLFSKYLARQAEARADGIVAHDGEVTPYEVGPVQPLDPKLAWDESLAVLAFHGPKEIKRLKAPPHWSQLVSGHESIMAIAFGVANFPQLMRSFHDILTHADLRTLRPGYNRAATVELGPWLEEVGKMQQFPQMLLALGTLRLAKDFDAAASFVRANDAAVPGAWRTAWENEKAAVLWHAGRHEEAREAWGQLEATPPVLFNRGMAALFDGDADSARQHLTAAVAQLPASSAWHHLGRLYLTLAQLRRS